MGCVAVCLVSLTAADVQPLPHNAIDTISPTHLVSSTLQTKLKHHHTSGLSPTHGLFATAGEDGQLECWDLRAKEPVGCIDAAAAAGAAGESVVVSGGQW